MSTLLRVGAAAVRGIGRLVLGTFAGYLWCALVWMALGFLWWETLFFIVPCFTYAVLACAEAWIDKWRGSEPSSYAWSAATGIFIAALWTHAVLDVMGENVWSEPIVYDVFLYGLVLGGPVGVIVRAAIGEK